MLCRYSWLGSKYLRLLGRIGSCLASGLLEGLLGISLAGIIFNYFVLMEFLNSVSSFSLESGYR